MIVTYLGSNQGKHVFKKALLLFLRFLLLNLFGLRLFLLQLDSLFLLFGEPGQLHLSLFLLQCLGVDLVKFRLSRDYLFLLFFETLENLGE